MMSFVNCFLILFTAAACMCQAAEVQIHENGAVDTTDISAARYGTNNTSKDSIALKSWSILEDIFPNATDSIAKFWGHPVHLPRSDHGNNSQDANPSHSSLQRIVPSISKQPNRFSHLIKLDDSLTVLQSNPHLVHGKDYYVLKYILKDGEEWNGQLPYESIPAQEIPKLLNQKAFSLVINNIDQYWASVKDFSRCLELETSIAVSCNLYITPPKKARAFESHMDWMDVIVLQLEGEKMWSVAPDPMIRLVLPDQKRKPSKNELQSTSFEDVLLQPGDALYIPRGHLHNATTLESGSHSMHLTFGILYKHDTTFEALLHYALQLYQEEHDNKYTQEAVVPPEMCEQGHKLTWVKLLHYSISELARQTNCGGYGEYGKTFSLSICSMRESVPLHPQFKSLPKQSDADIEIKYKSILDAILQQANALDAFNFMNSQMRKEQGTLELGSSRYQYVGMESYEPLSCRTASSGISQETLVSLAEDFTSFAKKRFYDARGRLIERNERSRMGRWKGIDEVIQA